MTDQLDEYGHDWGPTIRDHEGSHWLRSLVARLTPRLTEDVDPGDTVTIDLIAGNTSDNGTICPRCTHLISWDVDDTVDSYRVRIPHQDNRHIYLVFALCPDCAAREAVALNG